MAPGIYKEQTSRLGGGAGADRLVGKKSLLADTVGDVARFAFVGANHGQIVGAADDVKSAQGFPDLLVAGIDGGDLGTSGDAGAGGRGNRMDAAADGRANLGSR